MAFKKKVVEEKSPSLKQIEVPCFANKNRVLNAITGVIDSGKCNELNNFLKEVSNFINARCK